MNVAVTMRSCREHGPDAPLVDPVPEEEGWSLCGRRGKAECDTGDGEDYGNDIPVHRNSTAGTPRNMPAHTPNSVPVTKPEQPRYQLIASRQVAVD